MKLWDVSGDGKPWKVELDGALEGIWTSPKGRGLALFLGGSRTLRNGVAAVGAPPLGFKVKLGLARGK